MRIEERDGLIILHPDEGKILFKDDIESEMVVLGKYDKPENWHEKPKEELTEEIIDTEVVEE